MTASAAFTVGGSASSVFESTPGAEVGFALVSNTGVRAVAWRVCGVSDSTVIVPTLALAVTGALYADHGTLDLPTPVGESGYSLRLECKVNDGLDDDGVPNSGMIATALLGVPNLIGRLPVVIGEGMERDSSVGHVTEINEPPIWSGALETQIATSLSGNTNNWDPGDAAADIVFLSSAGAYQITGMLATRVKPVRLLFNKSAFNITLVHESASSDAANRFTFLGATNVTMTPNTLRTLVYDATTSRWFILTQ